MCVENEPGSNYGEWRMKHPREQTTPFKSLHVKDEGGGEWEGRQGELEGGLREAGSS